MTPDPQYNVPAFSIPHGLLNSLELLQALSVRGGGVLFLVMVVVVLFLVMVFLLEAILVTVMDKDAAGALEVEANHYHKLYLNLYLDQHHNLDLTGPSTTTPQVPCFVTIPLGLK